MKKVYMLHKVSSLVCLIIMHVMAGETSELLDRYAKERPELSGLIGLDIPITLSNDPTITSSPRYIKNSVALHATLSPAHSKTSVDFAYAFQYGALAKFSSITQDIYAHHLFEVLSQYYAQQYLACLSEKEQQACLEELFEITPRLGDLVEDCRSIIAHHGDDAVIAHRIARYYMMKNRQESKIINLIDRVAEHAAKLFPLARPTHKICFEREQDRLKMHFGLYIPYLKFIPNDSIISRSSCDGALISKEAFVRAELSRQRILAATINTLQENSFEEAMKNLHQTLLLTFVPDHALASKTRIITFASPADGHHLATTLSLLRHNEWENDADKILINKILIADNAIDPITLHALNGNHAYNTVPSGTTIQQGTPLEGLFPNTLQITNFMVRDHKTGICIPYETIVDQVTQAATDAIHNNQHVIIQMAHTSNTGQGLPDVSFLTKLKLTYPQQTLIIIDAHQSRCTRHAIAEWLDSGFCVLISGSFFFSGPPFTSMLLMPEQEAADFEEASLARIPQGLGDYIPACNIDERLRGLKDALPPWHHHDLFLRWQAALHEIERYYTIDGNARYYCANQWFKQTQAELQTYEPHLQLFPICDKHHTAPHRSLIGGCNTILSFTVHRLDADQNALPACDLNTLIKIHRLLAEDISSQLPATATSHERWVAQQQFLIGQPIAITTETAPCSILRIALSASTVVQFTQADATARSTLFAQHKAQNQWLFTKIVLILKHIPLDAQQ